LIPKIVRQSMLNGFLKVRLDRCEDDPTTASGGLEVLRQLEKRNSNPAAHA